MRWLGIRELTRHQLRTRLRRAGHATADVEATLDRLVQEGRANDRRAAEGIARRQVGIRGRGPARLLKELGAAGVPDALAREVVREAFVGEDEAALVARALRRYRATHRRPPDARRVYAALVRQGFTPTIVRQVLREHLPSALSGGAGDDEDET